VKVGQNLTIDGYGTLNAVAGATPVASATVLGGIKVGANLFIDGYGVLSAPAPSGGAGANAPSVFSFVVDFAGSDPTAVASLPSGWTSAIAGDQITITHNVGSPLRHISYWGYSASGSVNNYRLPSASNAVTIPAAAVNTQFVFVINTAVCGADTNGSARIEVLF